MRVSVIIPTHNEAQAISRVLADLPSNLVTEVIVVDSNSNDGTPGIAARMGARVIHEPRRGYGRACLTGLADANAPDIVVFLDGDYSDRPSELPLLLAPIAERRADITLGSRLQTQDSAGALPWHQVFGNRLAASLIRLLYGLEITDLGPFRAARADVLHELALEEPTYGWAVEMILKGTLAGFRVVEVPVSYYPRIGKSKISGTLKDTLTLARSLGDVEVAIMCPASDVHELAELAGNQASVVAQTGEGLAAALTSVFAHFTRNREREDGQRRTIAFNSDSPHLPPSVLEDAFETLAAHDVVVGPTHDGGYYLVGAKASHPTLFANDGMGTSSALDRLLSRARALGLSVASAPPFYDIDVADDLTRLAEELRLAPARAPRTAAWLKAWELAAAQLRTGTGPL